MSEPLSTSILHVNEQERLGGKSRLFSVIYTDLPEPWLLVVAISTELKCTWPYSQCSVNILHMLHTLMLFFFLQKCK